MRYSVLSSTQQDSACVAYSHAQGGPKSVTIKFTKLVATLQTRTWILGPPWVTLLNCSGGGGTMLGPSDSIRSPGRACRMGPYPRKWGLILGLGMTEPGYDSQSLGRWWARRW